MGQSDLSHPINQRRVVVVGAIVPAAQGASYHPSYMQIVHNCRGGYLFYAIEPLN